MEEWKSVKEELPPYDMEVLIYTQGEQVTGAYLLYHGRLWAVVDWGNDEQYIKFEDVEFWMYPPKKPESQEESE